VKKFGGRPLGILRSSSTLVLFILLSDATVGWDDDIRYLFIYLLRLFFSRAGHYPLWGGHPIITLVIAPAERGGTTSCCFHSALTMCVLYYGMHCMQ
jgi:hypothetical protein